MTDPAPDSAPDPGPFSFELTITATGSVTHPPDVLLDEQGHPVLDEHGEAVRKGTQ